MTRCATKRPSTYFDQIPDGRSNSARVSDPPLATKVSADGALDRLDVAKPINDSTSYKRVDRRQNTQGVRLKPDTTSETPHVHEREISSP